jgi:hypothetical protein
VDAVVSGGFPIAGDYSPLYPEIQALSAAAEADPAAWADLNSRFDNRAALARGGGVRLLAAGLDRRGLKHAFFPGHDHEGMLAYINEAIPSVLAWFDGLPRAE